MKILVLQLARLGDIYLTWPTLRALHRLHPEAELHVVVRERFAAALEGLKLPLQIHILKTKEILGPVLTDENLDTALERIEIFSENLRREEFDEIINLSFSPFSSYLAEACRSEITVVRGYCRQSDGYLAIPDDSSAYFYAQVGVKNWNRYHLGEIFAAVSGRDLERSDWAPAQESANSLRAQLPSNYCVVQVSTSQAEKSYPDYKWRQVLSKAVRRSNLNFVLVGGAEDEDTARRVAAGLPEDRVFNLVGLTRVVDLFEIIQNSEAVLACDSVSVHVASLCSKPVFNLSFSSVNFWETGPRSLNSRILWAPHPDVLDSERVVKEFLRWTDGQTAESPVIDRISEELIGFEPKGFQSSDFAWQLIEALYTGAAFPPCRNPDTVLGFQRLGELACLALDQLERIEQDPKDKVSHQILTHIDEILVQLHKMVPELRPVVAWFETERLRMGPSGLTQVLQRTRQLFEKLALICEVYVPLPIQTSTEEVSRDHHDMVE